jgi:hypothetical protein
MKKRILLAFLFVFVFLLSACSYSTDFVVINPSEDNIKVKYKLKDFPESEPKWLARKNVQELHNHSNDWLEVSREEYQIDRKEGSITVELGPNQALRLERMYNYSEGKGREEAFEVASIILTGLKGTRTYAGADIPAQFKKQSLYLYAISYE